MEVLELDHISHQGLIILHQKLFLSQVLPLGLNIKKVNVEQLPLVFVRLLVAVIKVQSPDIARNGDALDSIDYFVFAGVVLDSISIDHVYFYAAVSPRVQFIVDLRSS